MANAISAAFSSRRLYPAASSSDAGDAKGSSDAIALPDGDIFALSEAMLVTLEDDFVTIRSGRKGKQPSMAAMVQLTALLVPSPETPEVSGLAVLQPIVAVEMSVPSSTARRVRIHGLCSPPGIHGTGPIPTSPVELSVSLPCLPDLQCGRSPSDPQSIAIPDSGSITVRSSLTPATPGAFSANTRSA